MKSLLILATYWALIVNAQASTSWTTVTIYSTTTEYQRSTSTTTVSSLPQVFSTSSIATTTSEDITTTTMVTPSVELTSSSSLYASSVVLSETTTTTSSVQESTSLASDIPTSSKAFSMPADSTSTVLTTTYASTPETTTSSMYILISSLSTFVTRVVSIPPAGISSIAPFTPTPVSESTPASLQSTTFLHPLASPSSSSASLANTGFNLKVSKSNSTLDGSVFIARNTRFYLGLNASSPAMFLGADTTLNMTVSRLSNQAVFIGRLGGLRYTRSSVDYALPNGTITTGWQKQVAVDGDYSVSNEAGIFYACRRITMEPGVYQVYIDVAAFARQNCTAFAAVTASISETG